MKRFFAVMLAMAMMGTTAYGAEERETALAKPMTTDVYFDGTRTVMEYYNVNGYSYFGLRDIAKPITKYIDKQMHHFGVIYNNEEKSIDILRGMDYKPIEETEKQRFDSEEKTAVLANTQLKVNGAKLPMGYMEGYVIDGYTYFKLRDLAELLSLDVEWCEVEKSISLIGEQPREPIYDENGNRVIFRKPVIYLYPEETTDISVKVDCDLTVTYPNYNEGWKVTAEPDGTLTNHADGREYSYLFWEGEGYGEMDFSEGFVVKGEDTVSFLQDKLSEMGMTPREYNEFIVYWLPYLQDNAYNLISFQWENYDASAKLNITPEPDNMLRVFMAFKAIDEPIDVPEQKLPVLERDGFTVVEWGGTEVH